jgi:hypothetical protein
VQRVCSYVPQTNYQVAYRDVPVTSYHPVTTVDHCSGCAWTSYRPVTTCTRQAYYVPYTTYRPVCTNVAISTAPAVAYYAAPAVAAAPATGACCEGAATAPGGQVPSGQVPSGAAPSGPGLPQPAIEPSAEVPNAGGQSILDDTQSRDGSGQPAPVQQTNGWRFGGPGPNVSAPRTPDTPARMDAAPRDRTAMSGDAANGYRRVSLSKVAVKPATSFDTASLESASVESAAAIRPAGIVPARANRAATTADSWQAVR